MMKVRDLASKYAPIATLTILLAVPLATAVAGGPKHFRGRSTSVTVSVVPTVEGFLVHDINTGRDNLEGKYITDSNYTVSPQGVAVGTGVTIYLKNGNDRTFFSFEIDLNSNPVSGTWEVTGGTGRSANATGSGTIEAVDNGNGTTTLTTRGVLTR